MPLPPRLHCNVCGRTVDSKDFFANYNEFHEQYNHSRMFVCKGCCKEVCGSIMKKYWNPQKNKDDKIAYSLALREICSFFDMPYLNEAMELLREYELSTTKERNFNYVDKYTSALNDLKIPKDYWNNLSGNTFLAFDLFNKRNNNDVRLTTTGDMDLLLELEKDWGKQEFLEDYLWLEEKFYDYSKGEVLTPSMKSTMQYLCLAQLDVKKLKAKKEKTKELEKTVMDYYDKLGLNNFKLKENKTEIEKQLENWNYLFENIEPTDWESENLEDRLGIDKDYDDIVRSLGNKVLNNKDYPNLDEIDVKDKSKKKKKSDKL